MSDVARPTIGRIVHVVIPQGEATGPLVHRPAIVVDLPQVAMGDAAAISAVVFVNGDRDTLALNVIASQRNLSMRDVMPVACVWLPLLYYNESGNEANTWHWPEREGDE